MRLSDLSADVTLGRPGRVRRKGFFPEWRKASQSARWDLTFTNWWTVRDFDVLRTLVLDMKCGFSFSFVLITMEHRPFEDQRVCLKMPEGKYSSVEFAGFNASIVIPPTLTCHC